MSAPPTIVSVKDSKIGELDEDQQIRALAAQIVYPGGPPYPVLEIDAFPSLTRSAVYDEIEIMATYIRDGSKPS